MLKIKSEVIYPVEGDTEFCVTLRPLSFLDFQEIQIASAIDEPSAGPSSVRRKAELQSHKLFIEKLFDQCITKIEGIEFDGEPLKSGSELLRYAPKPVIDKIIEKLMSFITPTESERKN
jgi:hypothetical protein